jgi:hypothetical protein
MNENLGARHFSFAPGDAACAGSSGEKSAAPQRIFTSGRADAFPGLLLDHGEPGSSQEKKVMEGLPTIHSLSSQYICN